MSAKGGWEMRIVYGTGNAAKVLLMQQMLAPLDVEVVGITSLLPSLPAVDESGKDPLANARIKAHAYYQALGQPVFSCDTGLYIEGLSEKRQPGVHVRRVDGRELTDEEMTDYYISIAQEMGGSCRARYQNAICFVCGPYEEYCSADESLWGEPFLIVQQRHPKVWPGFPLEPISVEIETGKYYFDTKKERGASMAPGLQAFLGDALAQMRAAKKGINTATNPC